MKKKMGCLGNAVFIVIVLAVLFPSIFNNKNDNSDDSDSATSEQITTFESEIEETQTSSQDYDLGELNSKVLDSFIEASEFNQQGADGYEWTVYVKDIEINNKEAIHVNVINDFMLLDNSSKTEVLDSVQRCVGIQYFLLTENQRSFYTTAYDESGNKVAQSEMFNLNSYKFY